MEFVLVPSSESEEVKPEEIVENGKKKRMGEE